MAAFENEQVRDYVLDHPDYGLRTLNPNLSLEPWRKLVGFDVDVDAVAKTVKWSARSQIKELKAAHFGGTVLTNPGTPFAEDLDKYEPAAMPSETDKVAWAKRQALIHEVRCKMGVCCWVSEVRTDVKQVVSVLNAMAHLADEFVLGATNRVCHYLIATMDEGPTFGGCDEAALSRPPVKPPLGAQGMQKEFGYFVYSDGNLWSKGAGKGRSRLGGLHFYAGADVLAMSRHQHSVALTILDSEGMSATSNGATAVPLRMVLRALRVPIDVATPIYVDNESAVAVALDDASMKRSLYLIRRIWFLQELVDNGEVMPVSCEGQYNLADQLTKLHGFTKSTYALWRARVFGRRDGHT